MRGSTVSQKITLISRLSSSARPAGLGALALPGDAQAQETPRRRPNVLLIMTDDPGLRRFLLSGQSPHCHAQSGRSPRRKHAPEQLSRQPHLRPDARRRYRLIQQPRGRVAHHHGAIDPPARRDDNGGLFFGSGYRYGIFGKWHLGDNYPYRPQERGFQECCSWRRRRGTGPGFLGQ